MHDDESFAQKSKQKFDKVTNRFQNSLSLPSQQQNIEELERISFTKVEDLNSNGTSYNFRENEKFSSYLKRNVTSLSNKYVLPPVIIREVVEFYRDMPTPPFSKDASLQLNNQYMVYRESMISKPALKNIDVPILKSMIKISIALAKLKSSEIVEIEHVKTMISIFNETMFCKFWLEKKVKSNIVDRNDVSTLSRQKQAKIFLELLDEKDSKVFSKEELQGYISSINMRVGGSDYFIEALCEKGLLLPYAKNSYKLRIN